MPPRKNSRHSFATAYRDAVGDLVLTDPEPYRFKDFPDNVPHVVQQGDTLHSLAAAYFKGFSRPEGLWWIIGDFQQEPIHDPTIKLSPGRVLMIPSSRTVEEEIFSRSRLKE